MSGRGVPDTGVTAEHSTGGHSTSGHATRSATRRAPRGASPALRRAGVDVLAMSLLLGAGVLSFGPVFGGVTGYLAAGLGVAVGVTLAVVAQLRRWSRLGTALAVALAYVLLGGAVAVPSTTIGGVVPTLTTFQRLTLLSYQSWRDLLTVSLPAGQYDGPAAMPYLLSLVCAVAAVGLALHPRRHAWALVPTTVLLVAGILWGAHTVPLGGAAGLVYAVVALLWLAWRGRLGDLQHHAVFIDPVGDRAPRRRLRVLAVGAVAIAGVVGFGGVAALGAGERHVLRDDVVPPLDLRDYASPLTLFRDLETKREGDVLFTVEGLPAGARVRLAVMDGWDGNVYDVTDSTARFGRAGRAILPATDVDPSAEPVPVTVQVGAYTGVWLPGGGDLRGISFAGADSDREAASREAGLFYNPATGTALTTAGLAEGARYTVEMVPPTPWTAERLQSLPEDATPGSTSLAPVDPNEAVTAAAADLVGDAATAMSQVRAVAGTLRERGFYANGTVDASLAGHTAGRVSRLLDSPGGQMVGDDEQYAVATTLVARQLGLPARVVMGFYPDPAASSAADGEPLPITGDDSHVWTEVLFEGLGWVPFDSTPDEDKWPDQQQPEPQERNDPQVLPPPEVPEEPEALPPAKAKSHREDERDRDGAVPAWWRWAGLGGGGLAAASAPFLLVALAKSRRRRARRSSARPSDRVAGGWAELLDTATDLGRPVPRHATRGEQARFLAGACGLAWAPGAAGAVDVLVFGEAEPSHGDVEDAWLRLDAGRAEMLGGVSRRRRWRARFSSASLRRPAGSGPRTRRWSRPLSLPRVRLRGATT